MEKSIILGANGYIGRHLAYFLEKAGFENMNYDVQEKKENGLNNYERLDINDSRAFDKIDPSIDYIFLLAGITGSLDGFEKYQDFIKVNEIGILNILSWMVKSNCKARIVYPSSRLVYKGVKDYLLKEDDSKEPKTIYALNKIVAENLLLMYSNAFDINYTIFRICIPYGSIFADNYSYGTTGFFLSKAKERHNIELFGNGKNKRTFTHITDICNVIIEAIKYNETRNNIYNVGGEHLSLLEFANIIAGKFNVDVVFKDWPPILLKLETGDTIFDSSKIEKVIKIGFKYNINNWIDELE